MYGDHRPISANIDHHLRLNLRLSYLYRRILCLVRPCGVTLLCVSLHSRVDLFVLRIRASVALRLCMDFFSAYVLF